MTSARAQEQGYVLISAIWFLVLAGSIVALLMLNSVNASRQARSEGDILKARLALDAAVETIAADRIVNGDRSIWSRASAQGTLVIEGMAIQARSTGEFQRIDINRADMALIDSELKNSGIDSHTRTIMLGRIALWRGRNERMRSLADIDALFAEGADRNDASCLSNLFTIVAGGRTLATGQGQESVASGLGDNQPMLRPGEAQRLELRAPQGMSLVALLRVTGLRQEPPSLLDWSNGNNCASGS